MTCQMWARVVAKKARDSIQKSNQRSKSDENLLVIHGWDVASGSWVSARFLISASLLDETDQLSNWLVRGKSPRQLFFFL
ncbi:hypothetical protein EUGRSUZ_D00970 [Eucalyptus grandis]|uniref:Uncharacterized protein n=2 Tax=Eucalyptus grandis TaxID=71139 RepID=A0ACC3L544_EUCGR|nr:hypothetical protein EUGRSUZ_D00970 [Eucalyptus grandis]